MYTATDFNFDNAPEEMVQYVIDNVEDFDHRYQRALRVIGRDRCPLRMANPVLYEEISDAMCDWALDNNLTDSEFDEFDIEEIFG